MRFKPTEEEFCTIKHYRIKVPKDNHLYGKQAKILEYRALAEKALGKSLYGKHPVHHHYNDDGTFTLVICEDNAYHQLLHARARRLYGNLKHKKYKGRKKWWLQSSFYKQIAEIKRSRLNV